MERMRKISREELFSKKISAGLCYFFLILVTLFSVLFVIMYLHDSILVRRVKHYGKLLKAYELYVIGDKSFESFVRENNLKEVSWLLAKFNLLTVRKSLDEARTAFEKGNFADVISTLGNIKDAESPWSDEIFYLLGCAYAKVGRVEQAKFYLSYFLHSFEGSIYRKNALFLLSTLSEGEEKKKIEEVLKKLQ